jgi:drug/metabolite transporter (DMT)-like permease
VSVAPLDTRTIALTLLVLIAFASNSLLTRLALEPPRIDAATFTSIRLAAGAIMLAVLVRARTGGWGSWRDRGASGPMALLVYAVPFSFAYLRIGAAVGALVLFGVVQLTMIGYGIVGGERPARMTWLGLALAAAGLATLTAPSVARPDPFGVVLMAVAGVAWAVYSLVGRTAADPVAANAWSFFCSSPLAILFGLLFSTPLAATARGIALAVISGAVTSALGYAVWYRVLPRLSVTQAAVAQLSVPVIAALGAVLFLGERVTVRFAGAAAAVLTGVALALVSRSGRRT